MSGVITATQPIIVERAMYLDRPGQPFAAGHESAGVTATSNNWFLAEGATGSFLEIFVLIANPNPTASNVTVDYLLTNGSVVTKDYTVAANSRFTIWVDEEQFPSLSGVLPDYGRFDPLDWGLGVQLNTRPSTWMGSRTSPKTFGHFGGSGTFLWVDPEASIVCAALTTREFGDWAKQAWPRLADAVLAEVA